MIVQKTACLDLAAIADSGQCFRWKREGEGYRVIALGKVLHAWQEPGKDALYLDCSQQDFDSVWKNYLDLDTDYPSIIAAVPPEDVYLRAAAEYGQGIRILRQEPWETLITFILSQRKKKFGLYYRFPMFFRCWLLFVYYYIFRLGFLDGKEGFVYHWMYHRWYRTLVDAKILEQKISKRPFTDLGDLK